MSSLNLSLSRKNPEELIAMGKLVAGKLAPAAPATPPLPDMSAKVAGLVAKTAAAEAANVAYETGKTTLKNLKQIRDRATDELRLEHAAVASAVESEARGNPVLLTSSGYSLAADIVHSNEPPAKIGNLTLTAGDADSQIDGQHDPVPRAASYQVQQTTVDPLTGPWETVIQQTSSNFTVSGLTSGQRVWIRVRAVGAKGHGPWSDPATKIVP